MKTIPLRLLDGLRLKSGASADELERVVKAVGAELPADYKNFLMQTDGAEGATDSGYIQLWSASHVAELNAAYAVDEFAPGLILFATDGGATGYGFDTRTVGSYAVVEMPLVGMAWSASRKLAESFLSFMLQLRERSD